MLTSLQYPKYRSGPSRHLSYGGEEPPEAAPPPAPVPAAPAGVAGDSANTGDPTPPRLATANAVSIIVPNVQKKTPKSHPAQ